MAIKKTYYVKWSMYFDTHEYDVVKINSALNEVGATNIHLENQFGWSNMPQVVVFQYDSASIQKVEDALESAFKSDWVAVAQKDWRTKTKFEKGGSMKEARQYDYMLLGRMVSDCDYFLGNGNGYEKHLHQLSVDAQIKEMKRLWNGFPKDKKPEWLSMKDILDYEKKMKAKVKNKMAKGGKIDALNYSFNYKGYKVDVHSVENNGNYNVGLSVYAKGEKMPLWGRLLKDGTTKEEIKQIIDYREANKPKDDLNFSSFATGGVLSESNAHYEKRCKNDSYKIAEAYKHYMIDDVLSYEKYNKIVLATKIPKKELGAIEKEVSRTNGNFRPIDVFQFWSLQYAKGGNITGGFNYEIGGL